MTDYQTQILLAVENLTDGCFEPDEIPSMVDGQTAATCLHLHNLGIPYTYEQVRADILAALSTHQPGVNP